MERPTGVTILAVLSFLGAGLLLLGACVMFLMGAAGLAGMAGGHGIGGPLAALGAFAGVACLIFAVLYIVNGVGLLKLRGWGRLLTIVLVAISVLFGVMGLFRAFVPMHIVLLVWQLIILAIDVWILVYMFKPHVKAAFGQSA
jgi:hypothetical protein